MSLGTQGRDKLPRDIRAPGPLRNDAVVGVILSLEERSVGPSAATSQTISSQSGDVGGSAVKGKSRSGKGKKGKGARSDTVLEIVLCGGTSPADVLQLQAWEPDVRGRLRKSGAVGETVRISRCLIVAHTDKTRWYSTSRSPMFLKALGDTTMERVEDRPAFLKYHPVTPIASLPLLPPRSAVCVGGRVVEAGDVAQVDTPDGDSDVPVAHLVLRVAGDVIRVNFWRETSGLLKDLRDGDFTFLWSVAKQWPKTGADPKTEVELRATARTRVLPCPEPLKAALSNTPADLCDARVWSSYVSREPKEKKDCVAAQGSWMSLSVLEAFCASKAIRSLDRVFDVPSVLLEFGSQLTYMGCGTCTKGWRDEGSQPCRCTMANRVHLWRARLGLRDATGQIQAVCFRAIESVVQVYGEANGDLDMT